MFYENTRFVRGTPTPTVSYVTTTGEISVNRTQLKCLVIVSTTNLEEDGSRIYFHNYLHKVPTRPSNTHLRTKHENLLKRNHITF